MLRDVLLNPFSPGPQPATFVHSANSAILTSSRRLRWRNISRGKRHPGPAASRLFPSPAPSSRLADHSCIGAVESQTVLQCTDDQYSRRRSRRPVLDLLLHRWSVALHKPHHGCFVETGKSPSLERSSRHSGTVILRHARVTRSCNSGRLLLRPLR
jgi:hypothetical protein